LDKGGLTLFGSKNQKNKDFPALGDKAKE